MSENTRVIEIDIDEGDAKTGLKAGEHLSGRITEISGTRIVCEVEKRG